MSSKTTGFANSKAETFFERHAWKVFLAISLFIVLIVGLTDILAGGSYYTGAGARLFQGVSGMTWEQLEVTSPNAAAMIDFKVRLGGLLWVFVGLFSMAIVLTGFRCGERWAWYTMWLLPFLFAFHQLLIRGAYKHPEAGIPLSLASGLVTFIITILTLVLSYRKFFPN